MIGSYIIACKRNYPKGDRFDIRVFFRELGRSVWALAAVLIVVVGVLLIGGGWMLETLQDFTLSLFELIAS